jgi:hypothetical protein
LLDAIVASHHLNLMLGNGWAGGMLSPVAAVPGTAAFLNAVERRSGADCRREPGLHAAAFE